MNPRFPRMTAKSSLIAASCALLAACGGGGGGGGGDDSFPPPAPTEGYVALEDTTATQNSPLGFVAISNANVTSFGNAGTLDHDGGTVNGGLLNGTINAARTRVTLTGGGSATLTNPTNANTDYVVIFNTSGLTSDRFGVVGVFTNTEDVPLTGTSSYNGAVVLQADNNKDTFALEGDALITVGWDAPSNVQSFFDNLDGTKNENQSVGNVGTITISNATVSGNTFSGGTLTTTGADLAFGGGGTLQNEGQFFGLDATEVGGVFSLDAADLELTGIFIAKGGLN